MAPDRPDATGIEATRGPTVTRVLSFGETVFTLADGDNASTFTETIVLAGPVEHQDNEEEDASLVSATSRSSSDKNAVRETSQPDDDLTSLAWLHQQNLLKGLEISSPAKALKNDNAIVNNNNNNNNNTSNNNNNVGEESAQLSENTNSISSLDDAYFPAAGGDRNGKNGNWRRSRSQNEGLEMKESPGKNKEKASTDLSAEERSKGQYTASTIGQSNQAKISLNNNNVPVTNRNKHPTHIPYDPHLHRNSKPPYSFSCLIFMAIEDSPVKALPVKEVYAWILDHFPYFRNAPTGWKNSVRHNLSLNKCFRKVEKAPNLGKGSLWMVDAQYRPNLIQALSRAPFPPPTGQNIASPEKAPRKSASTRLPDPVLFPYLSKRLASSNIADNSEHEVDSDVDAAAVAMLSFKHGPIILNHNKDRKRKLAEAEKLVPVITTSSSEDHTYSCIASLKLDGKRLATEEQVADVDEQRKIAEGADALLNLAGVSTAVLSHASVSTNRIQDLHTLSTTILTATTTIATTTTATTTTTTTTTTTSSASPPSSRASTNTILNSQSPPVAANIENSTKSKRRSSDYSSLPDKRRRRWREWGEGNRYLKQVRG